MKKLKILAMIIGLVQLVLGILLLFTPVFFLQWMGLSVPHPDDNYMFGMLAARFIAYGIGMFVIAKAPEQNLFW